MKSACEQTLTILNVIAPLVTALIAVLTYLGS